METIKQPDLYQCEVCGTAYKIKGNAELCEAMPVEQLRFSVGDRVKVESRYNGTLGVTIEEILPQLVRDSYLWLCDTEGRAAMPYQGGEHRLRYRVSENIEISKDGEKSCIFGSGDMQKAEGEK